MSSEYPECNAANSIHLKNSVREIRVGGAGVTMRRIPFKTMFWRTAKKLIPDKQVKCENS